VNHKDKEDALTLELLRAVESDDFTQRRFAQRMGIALGLANCYLKRCVREGLVKARHAPPKRSVYRLTRKGLAEENRLTTRCLSHSFAFYRRASESCLKALNQCKENGWHRVVLCGVSELGEIASLRARDAGVRIVAVYDPAAAETYFLRFPVSAVLNGLEFDACFLSALHKPRSLYEDLASQVELRRIVVPDILGLSTWLAAHRLADRTRGPRRRHTDLAQGDDDTT